VKKNLPFATARRRLFDKRPASGGDARGFDFGVLLFFFPFFRSLQLLTVLLCADLLRALLRYPVADGYSLLDVGSGEIRL